MIRYAIALFIIGVLVFPVAADAQRFPTPYKPSAHSFPSSTTTFQFDIPNSSYLDSAMTHQLVYRDSLNTSWVKATMSMLYQTCTTFTYSGSVNFQPPSGSMEYYFRSQGDTAVVSMSPKNSTNTFPAPVHILADMGADPSGDVTGTTNPFLDLTGMQMGYSDTKIFARITNVSGGYPTNSGLTFFLYGVGLINPDESDSVGYAMVYVNVPLLMSAGLYRINPTDTSFTKIGNISTNITGNALSMSCNISDLTAQPGWGVWPPPSGFILTVPMTATQTTSGFTTNDMGKGGIFLPKSYYANFNAANTTPSLSAKQVTLVLPDRINASISYADANGDLPVVREMVFGVENRQMKACEKNYAAGSLFTDSLTVTTSGWYRYHFRFSDGKDTVLSPTDSILVQLAIRGDADGNGGVDISDVVFLISYIFSGGPAPSPLFAGDANCDGAVDISDAVFLIAYIFSGGPAPCI